MVAGFLATIWNPPKSSSFLPPPPPPQSIADLSRKEIADGAIVLREKLSRYRPRVAVFNGKAIYEVYSREKKFMFGKQPSPLSGTDGTTTVWVMPSSSARCAQLPRAVDKVPFFSALKRYLDFLKGLSEEPHEEEIVFANVVLKNYPRKVKKEEVKEEVEEGGEESQNGGVGQQQRQENGLSSEPGHLGRPNLSCVVKQEILQQELT